jgi:IS66 Orf2 like protein
MLTLPPSVRVYVAAEPTDLRRSFDGLSALVGHGLGHDPLLCVAVRYVAASVFDGRVGASVHRSRSGRTRHIFFRHSPGSGAPRRSVDSGRHTLP